LTVLGRASLGALGLLLGAQAIGKLLDMNLYAVALDRFRAFPARMTPAIAVAWVGIELVAFLGLGQAAVAAGSPLVIWRVGAIAAVLDAVAYAVLTLGTSLRGIEVFNCTCFGAFLPQRLSPFVLAQDIAMVAWTFWATVAAVRAR
jgi:hypothetical protein